MSGFRVRTDAELAAMPTGLLFGYFRGAVAAGAVEEAERALKQLLHGFEERITFWARRKAKDPLVVEEIVARVFYEALKSIDRAPFEGTEIAQFGAWLRQITFFTVADHYREVEQRSVEGALPSEHEGEDEVWGDLAPSEYGRKHGKRIEQSSELERSLIDRGDHEALDSIVDEAMPVNPIHRRVIEVAGDANLGFDGMRANDAAEMVNRETDGDAKMTDVNVHKILSRFRKRLDEERQSESEAPHE